MNIAEWIMAAGIAFGISLLMFSIVKDDPWNDHVYDRAPPISAGVPSPHRAGRQKMVCSSCHEIINPTLSGRAQVIPPIVSGAPAPHIDGREKQLCSHCHKIISPNKIAKTIAVAQRIPVLSAMVASPTLDPEWHEKFHLTRFQGKVVRVVEKTAQSGRENLNILIDDGINKPAWYNLAPRWFLKKEGCSVQTGFFVKGTAYKEIGVATPQIQYVKTLSVNGQFCDLRNTHMNGLWEPGAVTLDEE
ncbi:MAG: magnetochrome domain-containing protein [Magnetococcales bacterium]|nr:magnetochrome domain-containing protein [Magnetococcales bacterium]